MSFIIGFKNEDYPSHGQIGSLIPLVRHQKGLLPAVLTFSFQERKGVQITLITHITPSERGIYTEDILERVHTRSSYM